MTLMINDVTQLVRDNPEFRDHERVIYAESNDIRFRVYIAIHSTARGPALGGCRYTVNYREPNAAITDALRLSRAMTQGNALADLPLGGGQAIILTQPGVSSPTPDMMRALGRCIEGLQGRFVTVPDFGVTGDLLLMTRGVSPHVGGLPIGVVAGHAIPATILDAEKPGADPSSYTAQGVVQAMRAAVRHRLGHETLDGVRVGVKGFGRVGSVVARCLASQGAIVTVAETDDDRRRAAQDSGFVTVDGDVFANGVDVFCPCAFGGDLNDDSIPAMARAGVKIVCGPAHHQLADAHHAERLRESGILYVPEVLATLGGTISIGVQHIWAEYPAAETFPTHAKITQRISRIYDDSLAIFKAYTESGMNTVHIVAQMAGAVAGGPGATPQRVA